MSAIAEPAFDMWPQLINTALIEPATGIVRVCRHGLEPIVLDSAATRELAAAAADDEDRIVLLAAAEEAERQESQLTGVMEAPSWLD